jgi:hypothetical protein
MVDVITGDLPPRPGEDRFNDYQLFLADAVALGWFEPAEISPGAPADIYVEPPTFGNPPPLPQPLPPLPPPLPPPIVPPLITTPALPTPGLPGSHIGDAIRNVPPPPPPAPPSPLDELLKRPVSPRPTPFEELLKRPVGPRIDSPLGAGGILGAILGRILVGVGGVLWPSPLGGGEPTAEEVEEMIRRAREAERRIPPSPLDELVLEAPRGRPPRPPPDATLERIARDQAQRPISSLPLPLPLPPASPVAPQSTISPGPWSWAGAFPLPSPSTRPGPSTQLLPQPLPQPTPSSQPTPSQPTPTSQPQPLTPFDPRLLPSPSALRGGSSQCPPCPILH